jgi:hypothetical protein
MPAFQSFAESGLSQTYRLNAIGCEKQAERAIDPATERQWHELAAQWQSMADRAAQMQGDASQQELDSIYLR